MRTPPSGVGAGRKVGGVTWLGATTWAMETVGTKAHRITAVAQIQIRAQVRPRAARDASVDASGSAAVVHPPERRIIPPLDSPADAESPETRLSTQC